VPVPVQAAPAAAGKDVTRPAKRNAVARAGRASARPTRAAYVINVTCNSRLASCQRWINQQVNKLVGIRVVGRDEGPGA
jgi:hypothetical protein